jgi:hypothetical protein
MPRLFEQSFVEGVFNFLMNELWCRDWTLCLQEILSILGLTLQVLAQATTEGVREEVLASHQGQALRKFNNEKKYGIFFLKGTRQKTVFLPRFFPLEEGRCRGSGFALIGLLQC